MNPLGIHGTGPALRKTKGWRAMGLGDFLSARAAHQRAQHAVPLRLSLRCTGASGEALALLEWFKGMHGERIVAVSASH